MKRCKKKKGLYTIYIYIYMNIEIIFLMFMFSCSDVHCCIFVWCWICGLVLLELVLHVWPVRGFTFYLQWLVLQLVYYRNVVGVWILNPDIYGHLKKNASFTKPRFLSNHFVIFTCSYFRLLNKNDISVSKDSLQNAYTWQGREWTWVMCYYFCITCDEQKFYFIFGVMKAVFCGKKCIFLVYIPACKLVHCACVSVLSCPQFL